MINNQLDKLLNSQDSKDLINLMKHFMLNPNHAVEIF